MSDNGRPIDRNAELSALRYRMLQLAYRFLFDRNDAEDVVQNAFAIAHQKRSQLDDAGRLQAWMSRIVVRQALLFRRSESRRKKRESVRAMQREAGGSVRSGPLGDASLRTQRLRSAIESLPERQRAVVTLRHLADMPFAEIAKILEISESTARVQARNGRESLLRALEKRPVGSGAGRSGASGVEGKGTVS